MLRSVPQILVKGVYRSLVAHLAVKGRALPWMIPITDDTRIEGLARSFVRRFKQGNKVIPNRTPFEGPSVAQKKIPESIDKAFFG
jgi:hypothetical protein